MNRSARPTPPLPRRGPLARWPGLEPGTDGLENRCSIHLSYHREGKVRRGGPDHLEHDASRERAGNTFAGAFRSTRKRTQASIALRMKKIRVLDSHTGGEPTRLVLEGGPDLGTGPLERRAARLRDEFDAYRSAIVNEPRGSDPMVGALLVPPHHGGCDLGVIFFNNVSTLGMCGHGTIGLVASLAHLGRVAPGRLRVDTPVGTVEATLHPDGSVSVDNVPSRRAAHDVVIEVPGHGPVRGDVAWGGNWFFLVSEHPFQIATNALEALTDFAWRVRRAVNAQGFPDVDHVELCGPAGHPGNHGRGFVLCPGKAWDRSPCGTGTSAKLACLAADGKLAEGKTWLQESVIGSVFSARYRWLDRANGIVAPTITGTAHVMAETTLLLDERDLFCWGIRG